MISSDQQSDSEIIRVPNDEDGEPDLEEINMDDITVDTTVKRTEEAEKNPPAKAANTTSQTRDAKENAK